MPGALNYSMNDLYPGMSNNFTTRETTIAPPDDQQAIIDATDLGNAVMPAQVSTQKKTSIWLTVGIIFAVIVFMGGAK